MSDPVPLDSLRERKKQQTRSELANAAYAVVRDHGIASLTADAVAQRAGVSRRTFFNYFTTVDSALEPIVEEFLRDVTSTLVAVELGGSPMAALAQAVYDNDDADLLERITVLGAAAVSSESHRSVLHSCSQRWLDEFLVDLRGNLGTEVDELYVIGAATALVAAEEASLRVWVERTGGVITEETMRLRQRLLGDAIARLGRGFDSYEGRD